jgi:hypothetical protein
LLSDTAALEHAKKLSDLGGSPAFKGLGMFGDTTSLERAQRLSDLASSPAFRGLGLLSDTAAVERTKKLSDLPNSPAFRGLDKFGSITNNENMVSTGEAGQTNSKDPKNQ